MPSCSFALFAPWPTQEIFNHLWQSTAFGVAILLLLLACKPLPARTRVFLASLGLFKFVVPASFLLGVVERLVNGWNAYAGAEAIETHLELPAPLLSLPALIVEVRRGYSFNPIEILSGLWLVGCLTIFIATLVRGTRRSRELSLQGIFAGQALAQRVRAMARQTGLRRAPGCLISEAGHGPVARGIFAPTIVLPAKLVRELAPAELDAILLHECIHLRRHDNFRSVLQTAVFAIFWFHPVVWLLSRSFRLDTEKACDEEVVAITADPASYVEGILKTVRHAIGVPQAGFSLAATPPIASRIRNIITKRRVKSWWLRGAVATVAGSLFVLSGQAGSFGQDPAPVPIQPTAVNDSLLTAPPNVPIAAAPPTEKTTPAPTRKPPEAAPEAATIVPSEPAATVEAPPATEETTYTISQVDHAPRLLAKLRVEYPAEMKKQKISGEVIVECIVDKAGITQGARVVRSSRPEFETAALAAAAQAKYLPGQKGGRAVATRVQWPIVFKIQDESGQERPNAEKRDGRSGKRWGSEIFDQNSVDERPRLIESTLVQPKLDSSIYSAGAKGTVVFILNEQGVPVEVKAMGGGTPFEKACVEAVQQWRFTPGKKGGRPVSVRMIMPMTVPRGT